jgi:AraC family transcriptional regulator
MADGRTRGVSDRSERVPTGPELLRSGDEASPTPAARLVRRVFTRPGLHAFEAMYEPRAELPEHGHAAPFFTYVLRGSYVERAGSHARECARGAVIFHDHESHSNLVGPDGTISLNVQLDPELWRELTGDVAAVVDISGRVLGGDIEWPALRVWREFQQTDKSSALGMEEAIVLLCGAARNASTRRLFEPHRRLDQCVDYLDGHLMDAHRLADVARIAAVHPMHLAKLFRQRFGCSMGEFVRRRRIAWACGQLAHGEATIAAIAHEAGFADHAHFTRTFTRIAGCTPRWYRARMTSR